MVWELWVDDGVFNDVVRWVDDEEPAGARIMSDEDCGTVGVIFTNIQDAMRFRFKFDESLVTL